MGNYSWLWESWRTHWPSPWVDAVLALMAVACGIIVGGERQRREKAAGLRTLSLVCLGSAVFTMLSFAFTSTTGDSGRVAAQIVTGIGFLGAGVILHGRRTITGMTTAATIWVAAAIGMAVGAGYGVAGLALSILVNRMLVLFFLYETQWHPDLHRTRMVLDFALHEGLTRVRLERVLVDYNLVGARAEWSEPEPGIGRLTLTVRLGRVHFYELLSELVDVPDVKSIREMELSLKNL
ncbi:MAG: MgtC/SapB family protein [Methylacidiphilales bacterium]|nr:MgtC/SapB family protein [Candidatus Methylacidiphilales bacterium]